MMMRPIGTEFWYQTQPGNSTETRPMQIRYRVIAHHKSGEEVIEVNREIMRSADRPARKQAKR